MTGGVRILAVLGGGGVALVVLLSAIRTVVVPRADVVVITRTVFVALRRIFDLFAREQRSYDARDRIMALYAPLGLVLLPAAWALLTITAFTSIFWGLGGVSLRSAFAISASSFTTLGSSVPHDLPSATASALEAVVGLGLVALLISYLPSIYASYQRRELLVSMLQTRAGEPPSAMALLRRHHQIGWLADTGELYAEWEQWFADLAETHTSQGSLAFFRSPSPHRSWVTAGGAVLDAASLNLALVDAPWEPRAALCLRAGYLSLRQIADYFGIPFDPDPSPDGPISIARDEFEDVCEQLAAAGVPLKADRDQAWRDFAGWRVNYDEALVNLAGLTMAPLALWSSDRSVRYRVRPRAASHLRRFGTPRSRWRRRRAGASAPTA